MSRKLILYIAMSLDGYIATEDGDIGFLSSVESPGEDYGYASFIETVDTIIWGRKTYDKVLSFGIEFPYKTKRCIVLSRTQSGRDENVEFYNGDIATLIQDLHSQNGANIYCDGGAEIVAELLKHSLFDTLIISIIPHLLGSGIRLFKDGRPQQQLQLKQAQVFPSGLVQVHYTCNTSQLHQ